MKIIFLNIWNCRLKKELRKFLNTHIQDTDIFCIQEAYETTKKFLATVLPNHILYSDYKYVDTINRFPQATYIKNTIRVIETKTIIKELPKTGLGLHTKLEVNGKNLNILNVHGVATPGDKKDTKERIDQSKALIEEYKNLEGLKIIGGDFNLDIDTRSVKLFENAGYINLLRKYNISNTRNKFAWERFPDSKQYYSDFVFTDPKTKIVNISAPDIEISDHLPIIVEIDL